MKRYGSFEELKADNKDLFRTPKSRRQAIGFQIRKRRLIPEIVRLFIIDGRSYINHVGINDIIPCPACEYARMRRKRSGKVKDDCQFCFITKDEDSVFLTCGDLFLSELNSILSDVKSKKGTMRKLIDYCEQGAKKLESLL